MRNAGARRGTAIPIDARIVADTIEGRGEIIDSEDEVGGYPTLSRKRARRSTSGNGTCAT